MKVWQNKYIIIINILFFTNDDMAHYPNLPEYLRGEKERLQLLEGANIDFQNGLVIQDLFVSKVQERVPGYSITERVDTLLIDQHGIIWERHRTESWFRPSLREWHLYPRWLDIRQERHLLAGTNEMSHRISQTMWLEKNMQPEILGWNVVFARKDGEPVYLDGLPVGTDFMVYPEDTENTEDKSKLIVNLRLVTQQNGCGITWKNVSDTTGNKANFKSFQEHSKNFRWAVLVVDGPVWEHMLSVKKKVFIGLPTWHIK